MGLDVLRAMPTDFYYRGHLTDETEQLARLESASLIAVDMESVSLSDLTAIGIGMHISPTEGYYFPIFPRRSEHLPLALWKVSDPTVTKIYHNGSGFDLPVLDQLAEEEEHARPDDVCYQDTSIWGQCSGLPGALQRIGTEWLGAADLFSIADLFQESNTRTMLGVPESRVAEKCLNDCRTTYQLYEYLGRTSTNQQRDCYDTDRRLVSVLRTMQAKGLGLRTRVLAEHAERLRRSCLAIQAECDAEGFNPGSPQQVGYVLASRGNVLPIRKGRIVTNEEVLESCDDPLAETVLRYRHDSKLLGTYVEPWLDSDRAYTRFRLDLSTGRLASGKLHPGDTVNRNLQNIPAGEYDAQGKLIPNTNMREIFRPDHATGVWTWADHGQIELRVLAYMSQDAAMLDAYKSGWDMHQRMADEGKRPRADGKTFNFAMVFGASNKMLVRKTGMAESDVVRMRAAWRGLFGGAATWMDKQQFGHNGEWVEDAFGRRMRLPEQRENIQYNERAFQAHIGKCAVNYPIQGTAASIVKRGMLMVAAQGADMRLQVHDEYLVDGPWEPPAELASIHPELPTPFETKTGPVWS